VFKLLKKPYGSHESVPVIDMLNLVLLKLWYLELLQGFQFNFLGEHLNFETNKD
jgi:hypothetical protein